MLYIVSLHMVDVLSSDEPFVINIRSISTTCDLSTELAVSSVSSPHLSKYVLLRIELHGVFNFVSALGQCVLISYQICRNVTQARLCICSIFEFFQISSL